MSAAELCPASNDKLLILTCSTFVWLRKHPQLARCLLTHGQGLEDAARGRVQVKHSGLNPCRSKSIFDRTWCGVFLQETTENHCLSHPYHTTKGASLDLQQQYFSRQTAISGNLWWKQRWYFLFLLYIKKEHKLQNFQEPTATKYLAKRFSLILTETKIQLTSENCAGGLLYSQNWLLFVVLFGS